MSRSHRRPLIALMLLLGAACAGRGGNSGCTALNPLPTARYAGPKTDNAVNLRLSPQGINYVNQNWQNLIEAFAPGQRVEIPIACTQPGKKPDQDTSAITFGDQGTAGCTAESCGRADGKCDTNPSSPTYDEPRTVALTVTGFNLLPKAPDILEGSILLNLETGKIVVDAFCAECTVEFSGQASPDQIAVNKFQAEVRFTVDARWDRLLTFEIVGLNGTQICGSNGAPAAPMCLNTDDVLIESLGGFCSDLACGTASWFKNTMLEILSPILQNLIRNLINKQSCEQCGSGKPECPDLSSSVTSSCAWDICLDDQTDFCVPRFLGVEGRVNVSDFLGSFGVPRNSKLDVSFAAGSTAAIDSGVNLGTRVGLQRVETHPCVPPASAPIPASVPSPNFDADLTFGYHAAVGVSGAFVNEALFHAQQSGALCLSVGTSTSSMLNSGLFKTFLPSLGRLATRDGKEAPMMIVLRPQAPPTIALGEGTFDPTTKKPIKPLLKFTMPQLAIDFYAQLDDRYARLFSLTADITLPLSLMFEGCSAVSPALGDLKQLVTNLKTADSELLAEDPGVLVDLVPAVVGVAEPMVATAFKPFSLPNLGNFKLKVATARGVGPIPGSENYHHLGLYAELVGASDACVRPAEAPPARLAQSVMPQAEQMRATGSQALQWPTAVIEVGAATGAEVAYRVDDGLWSTFAPAVGGSVSVSHPVFLIQGQHRIQVRTRQGDELSAPATVPFRVDWEPPEVALVEEPGGQRLRVQARDVISGADELSYSYRTGGGQWRRLDPEGALDLTTLEAEGAVEVRVTDAMGNATVKAPRGLTTALRPEASAAAEPATGCASSGSGPAVPLFALLALLALRRRG